MAEIIDSDFLTKTTTVYEEDSDGGFTIAQMSDVEPVVEAAKEDYKQLDERTRWKGDLHRVASIPLAVFWKLKQAGITKDPKRMKAWLNDPDNRFFRTRPGRI